MKILSYYLVFLTITCLKVDVEGGYHQKELLNRLLNNYDVFEIPIENDNGGKLRVEVGLSIQQIVDVDEKKQTIIFSGWLDMTWTDYNLRWDPAKYGNITTIRIPSTKIWIPDLLLYNSAEDFETRANVNAVLDYDGTVNFLPPGIFKSICQIQIFHFPFDAQACNLKFGSWTYDDYNIDLRNKSHTAQLDTFIENGEWILRGVSSYSESLKYECCPTLYPFVMFVISLKRRTLYFLFNLVFPYVFISCMSVLGFALPPDSGEKIALEITTLLSIIFFLQVLGQIIPESSISVPKLALYFASVMVISTLSIFGNVIVLSLHHKNVTIHNKMPGWVERWICGHLAKLLGMTQPYTMLHNKSPMFIDTHIKRSSNKNKKVLKCPKAKKLPILFTGDLMSMKVDEERSKQLGTLLKEANCMKESIGPCRHRCNMYQATTEERSSLDIKKQFKSSSLQRIQSNLSVCDKCNNILLLNTQTASELVSLKEQLGPILRELEVISTKTKQDIDDKYKSLNWKFAAMVIDRMCLYLFAVATLTSTCLFSVNIFYDDL